MKSHFDKVLVERPRYSGYAAKGYYKNASLEDLPTKEGMRKPHIYHHGGKELNENLAPLYRYLRSQVGRPWNKVYSDIRQMVGKNPNAVKGHILQHLYGFGGVHLYTRNIDGKIVQTSAFRNNWYELSNKDLYVDDYGILREYKAKNSQRKSYKQLQEEAWMKTARHLPDGNQAHKINGVWFLVIFKNIEPHQVMTQTHSRTEYKDKVSTYVEELVTVNDVFGVRGSRKTFIEKYGKLVYAVSKYTMSSKDLRKYGLEND